MAEPGLKERAKPTFVAVVPGSAAAGPCVLPAVTTGISATSASDFVLPEVLRAQVRQEVGKMKIKLGACQNYCLIITLMSRFVSIDIRVWVNSLLPNGYR